MIYASNASNRCVPYYAFHIGNPQPALLAIGIASHAAWCREYMKQ